MNTLDFSSQSYVTMMIILQLLIIGRPSLLGPFVTLEILNATERTLCVNVYFGFAFWFCLYHHHQYTSLTNVRLLLIKFVIGCKNW